MSALSSKLRSVASANGGRAIAFWCPGCDTAHVVYCEGSSPIWTWDGNVEAPTISPSILVTYNGAHPGQGGEPPARCHSFVRAGRIQFRSDCTHGLAGLTVDLPDFP